ncbi:MAG: hypothetical protein ACXWDO_07470, partial [Bacteroidia bacterium]
MPTRHIYLSLKILLLLLLCNTAHAQQGNIWAFGYQAGLDFNYSPPKSIYSALGSLINGTDKYGVHASTSMADCNGRLLFYGSPSKVY